MKLSRFLLPLAAIVMLLSSCTKEKALLETVPDDVTGLATVDIPAVIKEMGVKIENGKAVMPESLRLGASGISADELNMVAGLGEAADLKHAVVFAGDDYFLLTATVTDSQKLASVLESNGATRESKSGFDLFSAGEYVIAVRDNQMWVNGHQPEKTADVISSVLKKAADGSVGDIEGLVDFLSGDNLLNGCLNVASAGNAAAGDDVAKWGCFNARIISNKIHGEVLALKADGSLMEGTGTTKINLPVLDYVPSAAGMVAAIGISPEMDWDSFFEQAGKSLAGQPQAAAQIGMLRPFIESLDGTLMVAVGPRDYSAPISEENLEFIAMVHMAQDKVDQTVNQILTLLSQQAPVEQEADNLWAVSFNGMKLFVGNVDGYLTCSNSRPSNNHGSSLAARFSGKEGAISVVLPSLAFMHPSAPGFGVDFLMTASSAKGVYTLGLTGTDKPILQALIEL